MGKPVSGQNVFQNQAGPIPLSQLDSNFSLVIAAQNDTASYTNYFVDASGAPNVITVTVPAPLTFAYVTGIGLQVRLAITNTSGTVNINVNALGNKPVINNDGSALLVGQLVANSILELMYDGSSFRLLSLSSSTVMPSSLFQPGTVGAPSISFVGDSDTGLFNGSPNSISFSSAGALRFNISATEIVGRIQFQNLAGSVGIPAYSFEIDSDTGMYEGGANVLSFATGGVLAAIFDASQRFSIVDGNVGNPAMQFLSDGNTGIFRGGADVLSFATGGVLAAIFDSSQRFAIVDGSAGSPAIQFLGDGDTGFYRDTANMIAIALGGAAAGEIAQGSFTGTGTGFTAGVTATVQWQRVGNHIMLRSAAFSGTSNATTFTMTGLPAAISPGAATGPLAIAACSDNGVIVSDVSGLIGAGGSVITFQRNGSSTGFTAANSKGWALGFSLAYFAA